MIQYERCMQKKQDYLSSKTTVTDFERVDVPGWIGELVPASFVAYNIGIG